MKTLGLVIGLLFCGLATRAGDPRMPDRDRYGFFLSHNRNWARIPFQLHSNLIVVPVQINNSDTLNFILDTGVSHTLITDPSALTSQAMNKTRRIKLSGAGEGNNLMATIAIDNTLSMGALKANHHNVVMLDEDVLKLSEYVGTPIHGIFGYEVFENFVVNIDFQHREITLMKPNKYKYRKKQGDQLPITIEGTKVYTDALTVFDGEKSTPLRVILDTGAGHALLLDYNQSASTMPLPEKVIRAQLGRGLNGVINGSLGRIGKVRFGRYELANILASFPDSIAYRAKLIDMPHRQGNVGCELLRRFNVTFNYREQYMVMKPVRKLMREQFEHDMSGLELRAKGEHFRSYYVGHVAEGSPAHNAGLHEGDEVLFINKSSAKDLTISDIYKVLQEGEGREVSFLVRRSGQIFIAAFALKRMI